MPLPLWKRTEYSQNQYFNQLDKLAMLLVPNRKETKLPKATISKKLKNFQEK